jgi:type IV pilus assembly protein PilX
MPAPRVRRRFAAQPLRQRQRGVIMVLTLVSLVLLLIAVTGMLRSTDSSTSVVGSLAFRRDLTNRAEIAIAQAKAALNSGGVLYSTAARSADLPSANYSATRLPSPTGTGAIGVPQVLISDSAYTGKGYSCIPANCSPGTDGVLLRWVIDRQCAPGATAFDSSSCGFISASADTGGTAWLRKPSGGARALFRISVRVTGPRNTEAYIQTTAG